MSPPGRPKGEYRSAQHEGTPVIAPLLVFGWGNLSRGDDALGPLCVERLRATGLADGAVEFLDDYQLQVEHALDLVDRQRVLFIDASLSCRAPFEATALQPAHDASFTTHAMSPQALMQVFCALQGRQPPECTLLAIRAYDPCLSCATHALGQMPLDVTLRGPQGDLIDRIVKSSEGGVVHDLAEPSCARRAAPRANTAVRSTKVLQ